MRAQNASQAQQGLHSSVSGLAVKTKRRQIVVAVAAGTVPWPLWSLAQQPGKRSRIGLLFLSSTSSAAAVSSIAALRAALKAYGHEAGGPIDLEILSAEGRVERLDGLAEELVKRKVDLIVAGGGNITTIAARKATTTIPILMSGSYEAVEAGLIQSLARPGGNVTGVTVPHELPRKQLELLRELIPTLGRIAILIRRNSIAPDILAQGKAMVLTYLQLTLDYFEVDEPEDFAPALAKLKASAPGAMVVGPDPLFYQQRQQLIEFARSAKIPTMYPVAEFVEAGGLISFTVNAAEIFRIIARHIDKILKGAKPSDIPVEMTTTFELVLNAATAKALGIKFAPSFMLRVDRIVE